MLRRARAFVILFAAGNLPAQVETRFQDNFAAIGPKLNTTEWTTEFGAASYQALTQFGDWVNGSGQFAVDAGGARLALHTYNPTALVAGDSYYGTLGKTLRNFVPTANTSIELTVRLQLPSPLPRGLVYGIFFYGCTAGPCDTNHDEIDIELVTNFLQPGAPLMVQLNRYASEPLNEGHGRMVPLPPGFNLLDAHDWTIRWSLNRIDYLVDGILLDFATDFVAPRRMQVYLNAWAPSAARWQAAYSSTLQPSSSAAQNSSFVAQVRSVTVKEIPTPQRLRFVPLAPCRVMETRPEYNFEGRTGAFGPPFLVQGETRLLNLRNSTVCQVPGDAKAFVLNVTLIPRVSFVDFVTVFPGGELKPDVWTVRSHDGQIVANATIVKAQGGAINVHATQATDLIIDIAGYFTDASATQPSLVFYPLTPCRVIETRPEYNFEARTGAFGPPALNAQERRVVRFPASTVCNIPNAAAYSVGLTVIPPSPLAYMTIWPDGAERPNVSSINSFAGRTVTNHVIVPASSSGGIDLFASDRTHVVVDINGYFAADDGSNGLYYYPMTQARLFDSRLPASSCGGPGFGSQSTRTVPFATCAGTPATAKAYYFAATALSSGAPMAFLTAWPSGQARPNTSVLNAFDGQVVTNSALIPAGLDGAVDIFTFGQTNVALEMIGYFAR